MKKYFISSSFLLLMMTTQHSFLYAQSPIQQLEDITGQRIDRGSYGGGYDYPQASTPSDAYYDGEYKSFLIEQSYQENEKGVAAYKGRNWRKAIAHFKRALKFNPNNTYAQTNLSLAERQLDQEEANKKQYQRYAKIDKVFLQKLNEDIKHQNEQLRTLERNIKSFVPPLNAPTKTIHEGIILGLYNTQDQNKADSVRSPFTNKTFKPDEYFATSDNTTNWELLRGVMDNNFLGKYTLNTAWGKQLVQKLNGTHFDRLYAHSNGATVSEALIRENVITVNELNIIGGDRSYINYYGYNELIASGKVKRIVVWVNPGDIIPKGSSAGLLTPTIADKDEYLKNFAAFMKHKLQGSQGGANVEYRYLEGTQYKGQEIQFGKRIFDAHGLDVYFENMKTFFNQPSHN